MESAGKNSFTPLRGVWQTVAPCLCKEEFYENPTNSLVADARPQINGPIDWGWEIGSKNRRMDVWRDVISTYGFSCFTS
jgi:hypothetical protein